MKCATPISEIFDEKTDNEALINDVHNSNDDDTAVADYIDPDVAVSTPPSDELSSRICSGVNKRAAGRRNDAQRT